MPSCSQCTCMLVQLEEHDVCTSICHDASDFPPNKVRPTPLQKSLIHNLLGVKPAAHQQTEDML